MAGQGAGPSRRSHTKSRKGCKTCKRRHIRCDETFPQCRNCTKHQVRCDYMDNVQSDPECQNEQASLPMTPGTEHSIEVWQQTGNYPFPALQVFPSPSTEGYSKTELHLIHHLSSLTNSLLVNGTADLTLWTWNIPKFLSIASSYPYVMHALLSFSASHLAWSTQSSDARKLSIQHGGIALRGLHEAIGNFSKSNADAVLAASILLVTQATDWRSWSSLRAGIRSVRTAMSNWRHESLFAEYIDFDEMASARDARRSSQGLHDRQLVLHNVINALQHLKPYLTGRELELSWIEHLLNYVQRLQASAPAQTPEEQFSHLYVLRKWLFWVPTVLLQDQTRQGPAMIVLAYLYATALELEPLFPDIGIHFSAALAIRPLENILQVTHTMQNEQGFSQNVIEITALMEYARQAAASYRTRTAWLQRQTLPQGAAGFQQSTYVKPVDFDMDAVAYGNPGSLSPAFTPSTPMHLNAVPASTGSPYLEVPGPRGHYEGQGLFSNEWGAMPSPGFPPQGFQEEQMFGYGLDQSYGNFRGGFVPTAYIPAIWT